MKKQIIGVLDSGIGGLSLVYELNKRVKNCKIYYLSDEKNLPYGNKSARELTRFAFSNVLLLKSYNVKTIFLACNTLSCTVFFTLKNLFPEINFIGVFPPIEILQVNNLTPILLCTNATAKLYKNYNIKVIAFGLLARDVEDNYKNFNAINFKHHLFLANKIKGDNSLSKLTTKQYLLTTEYKINKTYSKSNCNLVVVLGCTHYFFIKNQIIDHFRPQYVLSGVEYAVNYFYKNFYKPKSFVKHKENKVLFINCDKNKYKSVLFGLEKEIYKKSKKK